jgi:beta-barrel assembly-enhancing protease
MKRLTLNGFGKNLLALLALAAIYVSPLAILAQTKVSMPKNRNSINKDIEVGSKAAAEIERTFPMVNDMAAERYINEVGMRLANAIPPEFQQRQFNCRFKIVNASDINAFALPACYLYVNRGMIDAAKNEGEMAGVMAHEIAHAMLRHGTAAGPGILTQIGAIGAIFGGAILGGQAGAQAGQVLAAGLITPYSRNFERQSDIVGAQIMARAGYDPRDLANMFRTIAGERQGGGVPEWLSTHPDPGNRFNDINKEASMLRVSPNPIKITDGFQRTQAYLRSLPPARTMAEIEKGAQSGQGSGSGSGQPSPTAGGTYQSNVPFPGSLRTYSNGGLSVSVPNNWRDFAEQDQNSVQLTFAPNGAYGDNGITHGVLVGIQRGNGGNLQQEFDAYVKGILQGNNYLQARTNYSNASLNGRGGYTILLAGRSPITGRNELARVYGTQTRNGSLLYLIMVVPEEEASRYNNAFNNIYRSLRLRE